MILFYLSISSVLACRNATDFYMIPLYIYRKSVYVYMCVYICFCCVRWSVCPTLCDPINYSPPESSVHGILQATILEWIAIPFSRGSSQPRDQTWVSCIAGRFFTIWATKEVHTQTHTHTHTHTSIHTYM